MAYPQLAVRRKMLRKHILHRAAKRLIAWCIAGCSSWRRSAGQGRDPAFHELGHVLKDQEADTIALLMSADKAPGSYPQPRIACGICCKQTYGHQTMSTPQHSQEEAFYLF